MGKEWLSWVAGGSARGGGGGGGGGGERSRASRRRSRRMIGEVKEATSSGCVFAVFQLFDLHRFQFPLNQQQPHGLEAAPRNSLELEETAMKSASFPLEEKNLKIPAPIQIRRRTSCDSISESSTIDSPGTKTPNLLARLMGLDLLPECDSPVISCSSYSSSSSTSRFPTSKYPKTKPHLHSRNLISRTSRISFSDDDNSIQGGGGGGSLPETPRISAARRSDVDHHHRLSLQINNENISRDFDISAFKKITRRRVIMQENDENRSPRHYAKQIVKQVRESFSRRVGLQDITNNTVKKKEQRRDESLLKKPVKVLSRIDEEVVREGTKVIANVKPSLKQVKDLKKCDGVGSSKSKKMAPRVSDSIRNKKEETFVGSTLMRNKVNLGDKKSKKTPLSSELPNINVPTLLPIKKDPSPPATKLPQKQVSDSHSSKRSTQLSCSSSHSYKQDTLFTVQDDKQPHHPITAGEYRQYVQRILKRIGIIDKPNSIIPLLKLRSPSRPLLDPSIFHFLELFHPSTTTTTTTNTAAGGVLTRRCNRKLIFQLVDELLAEILKPHNCFITWGNSNLSGSELIDELCKKIQSFPAANCRVLEDIDTLIDADLCKYRCGGSRAYFEEEGEGIMSEIERQIVDSLLHETIADFGVRTVGKNRA